jgi:DNA-binding Lrp family transcriptional regulator
MAERERKSRTASPCTWQAAGSRQRHCLRFDAQRLRLHFAAAIPTAERAPPMQTFFVEIKCALGKTYAVASALAEAEIASEIYSIAGDFDILAKFYVDSDIDIGHFVGEKVQVIPGIVDTRTIITFKAF